MDVEAIIDKLAEFGYVRTNKITGNYYSIYCPFHKDGQERRASCGVLLHEEWRNGQKYPEGWTHCFTCGAAHTLLELVEFVLSQHAVSRSAVDWLTENVPGFVVDDSFELLVPVDLMQSITNKFAVDYIKRQQSGPEYEGVSEEQLASYRYVVPYMYERGLTDELIEAYDIGFDANWIPPGKKDPVPCITFPVRDQNKHTLFLCRRSVKGKLFNYPANVTKPVYGIEMIPKGTKSVVVCESCIDALTAVKYGYPAVALLGTGNTYQIQQLKELGIPEYVICTDGDDAGRRAAAKLYRNLKSVAIVWRVAMPDGKDINTVTKEEFDQLYAERE